MTLALGLGLQRPATASGGPSPTDPYWSSVVLLLGFEGADASTILTDESSKAHGSAAVNGNAQIDTAEFKFGSSSGLFDGTGDYFSWADHADWDLSDANSDQFTIEFWMRTAADVLNQRVLGHAGAAGNIGWYVSSTFSAGVGRVQFFYSSTGSGGTALVTIGTATNNLLINSWHHIAISKNASGKIRIWRNGALDDAQTPADSTIYNSTNAFELGRALASANFNGWLDEVRITKGVCRYDTDGSIAVPTVAFPRG